MDEAITLIEKQVKEHDDAIHEGDSIYASVI